jgi:hypothetical protein
MFMSNHLWIIDIFLPCLCPINRLFVFIIVSTLIPWRLSNPIPIAKSETSLFKPHRERYCSQLCAYMRLLKFCSVDNLWYCFVCIIHYPGILFTGTKSTSIGDQLLADRGRYGSRHHSCMRPLNHFSIS